MSKCDIEKVIKESCLIADRIEDRTNLSGPHYHRDVNALCAKVREILEASENENLFDECELPAMLRRQAS